MSRGSALRLSRRSEWATGSLKGIKAARFLLTEQDSEYSNNPAREWPENNGHICLFSSLSSVLEENVEGRLILW